MTTKTTHELARELLEMEEVPVKHHYYVDYMNYKGDVAWFYNDGVLYLSCESEEEWEDD